MELRFFKDPDTGLPHISIHGVTEEEVAQVLGRPLEDGPGSNNSRIAIGKTQGGRTLKVVYVRDTLPQNVFVVTAYDLQGKPLKAFRRRQRKKSQ